MPEKTKKLVFNADAPDEVRITVGTHLNRIFRRADEPFSVNVKDANMLLRSFPEIFTDAPEVAAGKRAEVPAKETKKII